MTLPLFTLPGGALDAAVPGDCVVLGGAEGRHASQVRRLGPGEPVLVADGAGRSARAVVTGAGDGELTLRLETLRHDPVPEPRLVLVQALAKGGRDEDAVEAATEIGADVVVPWQAARSIVQWRGPRAERGLRKWRNVVDAATKQSRRTRRPEVTEPVTTRGLVPLVAAASAAYVLHEDATRPLAAVDLPAGGDVLVVVGPEGGIAPDEVEALSAAGALPVRLGSTVLRSSTAGPAALAVLSARARWR